MKMDRTLVTALLMLSLGALAVYALLIPEAESEPTPSDRFPILSRFELPRNYGYFIGDEIPLTLIIETTGGVVLDLVNLPQKGEKHGLFEVRDLTISSTSPSQDRREYRAAYTLQYFGITPLMAQFEGLEILYALPDDRLGPRNTYTYKSLFTQPVDINLSRIGPFRPTQPIDLKGPLDDRRTGLIWTSFAIGVLLLLIALGGWMLQGWRRRQQQQQRISRQAAPSAAEITLQALHHEGVALHPVDLPAFAVGPRLTHIIREYLQAAFAVPAFALTTTELAGNLNDQPFCQELLYVLERCDALKYQPTSSQEEERQLWGEAMTLFEKLHEADAP